jgi:hypothetical protein
MISHLYGSDVFRPVDLMILRHPLHTHSSQHLDDAAGAIRSNGHTFKLGSKRGVQLKLTGIPHREPQARVTTLRQAGGFAAISRWLSASDTAGFGNNNDRHPGGVPPVISIARFSSNASAATPPGCVAFLLMHTGGGATSFHPRLMACKPSA